MITAVALSILCSTACQGGALGDMNVYCLHLLVGLLGMPKAAEYRPVRGENGIDVAGLALLDYGRFTATALAAKDSNGRNGMVLQGPGGYLVVDGNPNSLPAVYSLLGAQRNDCVRTDGPAAPRHRMAYELPSLPASLLHTTQPLRRCPPAHDACDGAAGAAAPKYR